MTLRRPISSLPTGIRWRLLVWFVFSLSYGRWPGNTAQAQSPAARFVQEIPGNGGGLLVKCDLQHRFSDERLSVAQFVKQAADNGCQVVFVSPPKTTNTAAELKAFLQDVETARQVFPKTLILPAYAWKIQAPGFTDQATVILPPSDDFHSRFLHLPVQLAPPDSRAPLSESASLILEALCPESSPTSRWPAVVFNERPEGTELQRWAMGHHPPDALWSFGPARTPSQRSFGQIGLLNRWDQVEVFAGGAWDDRLAEGWNLWAASGGIDIYHGRAQTYQPGAFTETWLQVPELTGEHVIQAVKHGAFFGVRGRAARAVDLRLTAPGLHRAARPGETVDVPAGTPIRVELSVQVPEQDWRKTPHRLDGIELIAVTPELSRIVKKEVTAQGLIRLEYETEVPEGGILFRAIGYRDVSNGPDYGFHTNPIRVISSGQWIRPRVVVRSEPWLNDRTGPFVVVGMTLLLAVIVVAGWLISNGQFTLLFGDVLAPVRKRWKSSFVRRMLFRIFPGLRSRGDSATQGTALSESDRRQLATALYVSVMALGAYCGWTAEMRSAALPFWPAGHWGGPVAGALLGALYGGLLRSHAFYGPWLFFLVRIAADLWPGMIPVPCITASLSAAILGVPLQEALRTGTLRWPSRAPVGALIGLASLLAVTTMLSGIFPGKLGSLAQVTGVAAAAVWSFGNLDWARVPVRGLGVSFVTALWFSMQLTQERSLDEAGALLWGLQSLTEAIGVGLVCFACRPERLDAIGLALSYAALAATAILFSTQPPGINAGLTSGAAGLGLLLCLTADLPWMAALSVGLSAVVLGRLVLFSPEAPGFWLTGAAVCTAASLATRRRLRLAIFLLPYLLISGYVSSIATGSGAAQPGSLVSFLPGELASFREVAGEHRLSVLQTAGQFLCLFCWTGLTVVFCAARQKRSQDVFDGLGRTIGGSLVLGGLLSAVSIPLSGAAGAMLASFAGIWAAQVCSDGLETAATRHNTAFADRIVNAFRRRLGFATLVIAALIAYGSLVPFHWRAISGAVAVEEFLAQFRKHLAGEALMTGPLNSDRLVNLLLTVPLAFCGYGSLVLGQRGFLRRAGAVFETWQMSLAFSFLVELAQFWSIQRVASVHDVIAQAIGAVAGIALWIVFGEGFVLRLAAAAQERTTAGRWGLLLWPYLLGVLVFAVLPAGLPVTSPKQLYDRYRDGQLCLLPFADCPTWSHVLRDAVAGVVLFFPMGIWGSLAFLRAGQPMRSLWSGAANGAAFAALVTVFRGLCSAEMTDSSWLLTGAIGAALGSLALHVFADAEADRYAGWRTSLGWWFGSVLFGVILAGFFLHPWVFDASAEQVSLHWKQFINVPFANFHSGHDWLLIEEAARKLAWFAAWGLLLGQAVLRSSEFCSWRLAGGGAAMLLAAATSLGIELAQLFQSHHNGETTDIVIYLTGTAAGFWLRYSWLGASAIDSPVDNSRTSAAPSLASESWVRLLQTSIAVGLAIGVISGLVVLSLRR